MNTRKLPNDTRKGEKGKEDTGKEDSQIVKTYQSYVRPTVKEKLTTFCVDFLKITQQQVDAAPLLEEVLSDHLQWLDLNGFVEANSSEAISAIPVTWTGWDFKI